MSNLLPCPFCGNLPDFSSIEEKDDRRYVQMSLICCIKMSTTIPWPRWADLGHEKLLKELTSELTAEWNTREPITIKD